MQEKSLVMDDSFKVGSNKAQLGAKTHLIQSNRRAKDGLKGRGRLQCEKRAYESTSHPLLSSSNPSKFHRSRSLDAIRPRDIVLRA
jgi:hypothetical protein